MMNYGLQLLMPYNTPQAFRYLVYRLPTDKIVKKPSLACGAVPSNRVRGMLRHPDVDAWRLDSQGEVCSDCDSMNMYGQQSLTTLSIKTHRPYEQDTAGILHVRHGYTCKKAKSEIFKLVNDYVTKRCKLDHRPNVAQQVRAALNQVSKSMDANNLRKMRSSMDLVFLSWAYKMRDVLEQVLSNEPWEFTPEEYNPFLTGLRELFAFLHSSAPGGNAKDFRKKMHNGLVDLASSKNTAAVRSPLDILQLPVVLTTYIAAMTHL